MALSVLALPNNYRHEFKSIICLLNNRVRLAVIIRIDLLYLLVLRLNLAR